MDHKLIKYVLFLLYFIDVNTLTLDRQEITRYRPCGVGIIYFENIAEWTWQAVMNFEKYPKAVVDIHFDKDVRIYGNSETSAYVVTRHDDKHFTIQQTQSQLLSSIYIFFLEIYDLNTNEYVTPTVTNLILNNVSICNVLIRASHRTNSVSSTKTCSSASEDLMCGRTSLANTELLSVMTESRAGDWPWHVALLHKDSSNVLKCGGSIISRTAVLTGAFCVSLNNSCINPHDIAVVAGVTNYNDLRQVGRQQLTPTEIHIHPQYVTGNFAADLAVLKVNSFVFTAYVKPICISCSSYNKMELFGREATIVGFGYTGYNKPSEVLRAAYIKVQNDATCLNLQAEYSVMLNKNTFCAGNGPKRNTNPSSADGGGGIAVSVVDEDHKITWVLRGIFTGCISYPGRNYCNPAYYSIYTDLSPHYDWITNNSGEIF